LNSAIQIQPHTRSSRFHSNACTNHTHRKGDFSDAASLNTFFERAVVPPGAFVGACSQWCLLLLFFGAVSLMFWQFNFILYLSFSCDPVPLMC
jgi:hypothetical protein